jgi:hypothetical protein
MKQSAQKSKILSLVTAEADAFDSGPDSRAANLKESFDSWLNSVAPTLLGSTGSTSHEEKPSFVQRAWRSLSAKDITRVNRATVRESTDHRHWPAEVVMSFLAADVIKRNRR